MVYLVIASHLSNDDGTGSWISHATIAREANLSVSSVQRHLKVLRAAGVLTWETRKREGTLANDTNLYDLPLMKEIARGVTVTVPTVTVTGGSGHGDRRGPVTVTEELDPLNKTHITKPAGALQEAAYAAGIRSQEEWTSFAAWFTENRKAKNPGTIFLRYRDPTERQAEVKEWRKANLPPFSEPDMYDHRAGKHKDKPNPRCRTCAMELAGIAPYRPDDQW